MTATEEAPPARKGTAATIVVTVVLSAFIVAMFLILRTCQDITRDVGEGATDELRQGAVKTLDQLSSHPIK